VEKGELGEREKIILTSYMALQDRVEEALELVKKINGQKVENSGIMVVQYDYLRAYLSIFEEYPTFQTARELSEKYRKFADLSWRKMFKEISDQLNEYDESSKKFDMDIPEERDPTSKIKRATNQEQLKKVEYLKVDSKKDSTKFKITYMNLDCITVSFFKLNMEILFTKDPFLDKNITNFSYINPNVEMVKRVNSSSDFDSMIIEVPDALKAFPLFVHIQGKSKSASLKIFNSGLTVHPIEEFGLLKVADKQGKLMNSVYVKCYFKGKNGEVKFYKDGYTDFRGSFDYASLNSDSLDKVEKFSILVKDLAKGATVLEVKPPRKVGEIKRA
jgi:hypothetical protein